jgi:hypothetical protein
MFSSNALALNNPRKRQAPSSKLDAGRDAIKLYIDCDNKPHFEVYGASGKTKVYELKLSK